jgi:hypothetical protein
MQANLGVRLKCLDPTPEAPASWAAKHVQGHFRDAQAISSFVKQVGARLARCRPPDLFLSATW